MLNKQEAWKYVANDILEQYRYGFICNTLTEMYLGNIISNDTKLQMMSDLGTVVYGDAGYFHYKQGALRISIEDEQTWSMSIFELNNRRSLLCLFISQLSDSEIEEMNEAI